MKNHSFRRFVRSRPRAAAIAAALLLTAACEQPTVPFYNNPSEEEFTTITSLSQVQALVTGLLAGDRGSIGTQIMYSETMGRDILRLDNAEPRYITELLGTTVDPSNFLGGSVWPYSTIRLADVTIKGTAAANASVLTDAGKKATAGFAQTIKALEYIRVIETRDSLGAPLGTDLPNGELAAIRCKPAVLDGIAAILDSAAVALAAGGTSFPFTLPSGFAGFTTPANFLKVNRALAAKVDIYRAFQSYAKTQAVFQPALDSASAALAASFLSLTPSQLDLGPMHVYSTTTGDAVNPLYQDPASTIFRANPRVTAEAEAGDERVARATTTGTTKSLGGVGSNVLLTGYASNVSPIPIITNKELILMRAEVQWGRGATGLPAAMSDVNFIRQNDAGLAPLVITNSDDVLTQILKEKRYSLLFKSPARWIDARLFGRLVGEPPFGVGAERGNAPLAALPIPASEAAGRNGVVTCTP
jgi:hypothetical protein